MPEVFYYTPTDWHPADGMTMVLTPNDEIYVAHFEEEHWRLIEEIPKLDKYPEDVLLRISYKFPKLLVTWPPMAEDLRPGGVFHDMFLQAIGLLADTQPFFDYEKTWVTILGEKPGTYKYHALQEFLRPRAIKVGARRRPIWVRRYIRGRK